MVHDRTQPYWVLMYAHKDEIWSSYETRADAQRAVRAMPSIERAVRRGDMELRQVDSITPVEMWLDGPPMDRSNG